MPRNRTKIVQKKKKEKKATRVLESFSLYSEKKVRKIKILPSCGNFLCLRVSLLFLTHKVAFLKCHEAKCIYFFSVYSNAYSMNHSIPSIT